jgi:hypothetical protein
MKINIGIHKVKYKHSQWYHYFKPEMLNSISRNENDPKIYKWLWWYIAIE